MNASNPPEQLWVNARLATFDPAIAAPYGELRGHALLVHGEIIRAIVPVSAAAGFAGPVHDCGGRWVTPGFIDCHTHLVHGGSRAAEWEMRLAGVPYAEIARRGGGILNTVRATREMSEGELVAAALPRLRALMAEGVTCVEI